MNSPTGQSPEFRLLAACAAWPHDGERLDRIRAHAVATLDWPRFELLSRRHRMGALAWSGLSSAAVAPPPETARRMAGAAAISAIRSQQWRGATVEACDALAAAGLTALAVKGVSLSKLAFGDIALRHLRDIDILVGESDIDHAVARLAPLGWTPRLPLPEAVERPDWLRYGKNFDLVRSDGLILELHWRLTTNPYLLTGLTARSGARAVDLGDGLSVTTLSDRLLLIYLCVHGGTHGWMRMKWIADVGALLARLDAAGVEALRHTAGTMGARPAVDAAIRLCAHVLTPDAPAARGGATSRALVAVAMQALTAGGETRELQGQALVMDRIQLSQFRLAQTPRALLFEMNRKFYSGADRRALRLSGPLRVVYPLVRIVSLAMRRTLSARRPATGGALARWLALTPADRMLLAEAALLVGAASVAIRLLPFRSIARIAGRPAVGERGDPDLARRVAWAVAAAARRSPLRSRCFDQGLAAQLLLRRRGVASVMHYGVARTDGELKAHVWVTADGEDVVGGRVAVDHTELARFPAAAAVPAA